MAVSCHFDPFDFAQDKHREKSSPTTWLNRLKRFSTWQMLVKPFGEDFSSFLVEMTTLTINY
jgi:hypothetical protein